MPDGAALVVQPQGTIVEQLTGGDPLQRLVAESAGVGSMAKETLLKDLLDAIRAAKDDKRIKALHLDLNDMEGAGMTKLRDLRAAIADFRKSGKKVVAYGDDYLQSQYYLAAQADEVYLHPQGAVVLHGVGRWRNFYKEGLDRLGVEVHVFRVGEYKSAVEPYLRNDMSPEAKEMALETYGDIWRDYLADVAAARKVKPEDVTAWIESMPDRLRAAGGDTAKAALDAKLVDKLAQRDEVRQRMIQLVGEDKETKSFRQVGVQAYLRAKGGDRTGATGKGKAVAVVVAKGDILDGNQPAGTIGGDSTARLLRRAREDDDVKAVVLRVDSGGGSAFASEIIRRECELVRKAGKPLVVSMGSVAASGGYWIATSSDEIWAAPETITGSIGIFGLFPTIDKPLAKYLGVHTDGVGTTRFTDALRPDRPLDPAVADIVQQYIDDGYEDFLARVAPGPQDDAASRWTGSPAGASGAARTRRASASWTSSAGSTRRSSRRRSGRSSRRATACGTSRRRRASASRLMSMLAAEAARRSPSPRAGSRSRHPRPPLSRWRAACGSCRRTSERLSRWNDPHGVYAHCLCTDPE